MTISHIDKPRHVVDRAGLMLTAYKNLNCHSCHIKSDCFINTDSYLLIREFFQNAWPTTGT